MRDAVGGAFMIKVFIVFLFIYIIFIAAAFNYARAFRVKNKIIDIIEQNEGMDFDNNNGEIKQIDNYLNNVKYNNYNYVNESKCPAQGANEERFENYYDKNYGYCVARYQKSDIYGLLGDKVNAEYYKVTTFVTLRFPFLNLSVTLPITGETRKIERITT